MDSVYVITLVYCDDTDLLAAVSTWPKVVQFIDEYIKKQEGSQKQFSIEPIGNEKDGFDPNRYCVENYRVPFCDGLIFIDKMEVI